MYSCIIGIIIYEPGNSEYLEEFPLGFYLPTAVLNFDAMLPSEVRDRGHLVLTPLILAQPKEVVPTAAASEQNGLEGGWEGVEAMDMVR